MTGAIPAMHDMTVKDGSAARHAGFPGGDVDGHLRSIPACAALGLRHAGEVATLVGTDVAAARDADGRIDRGAALLLADQATAAGVFASLSAPVPMMTLDLRVDWLAALPADTLYCDIEDVVREGGRALVRGRLNGADGPVGSVLARYLLGAMPGGEKRIEADGASFARSAARSFADYLGAVEEGDALVVTPGTEHIGARTLPAFHGGVIAALLEKAGMRHAAEFRPTDIDVRFLSPARADRPLIAQATPRKLGRRAATIDVAAHQGDPDRPVAIARLLAMNEEADGGVEAFAFATRMRASR
jgi:uncharacterized protein (TIGR00369 family)